MTTKSSGDYFRHVPSRLVNLSFHVLAVCLSVIQVKEPPPIRLPSKHSLITPPQLLQRSNQSQFLVLLLGNPEFLSRFHDISQDSTTQEDHVFSTRWIFDSDFEILRGWDGEREEHNNDQAPFTLFFFFFFPRRQTIPKKGN